MTPAKTPPPCPDNCRCCVWVPAEFVLAMIRFSERGKRT